jgi:hypothetical protein
VSELTRCRSVSIIWLRISLKEDRSNGRKEIRHSGFSFDIEDMALCPGRKFVQSSIDIRPFA